MLNFWGSYPKKDYIQYMQGASFLIIPSLCFENFPCVIMEAKSCGVPIIASNLGGMPEIINNRETGFLFEPGNPDDLCKTIKVVIDSKENLLRMRENILTDYNQRYSSEENLRILEKAYNKAIEQNVNRLRS